jgi:flagellar hook-length control protein FliK
VPTVASASVQPHAHASEARGRPHAGREPAHPFAELLDGTCDAEGSPPSQVNNSGPKDSPGHAADTHESKECKSGKDDKCTAKDSKKAEKAERKEARQADKANRGPGDHACAESEEAELLDVGECIVAVEDTPVMDEATTGETIGNADPLLAALAPLPSPPAPVTPEAVITPPAIMPPDLAAAIGNAEPVEAMPAVQPLGAASPQAPVDPTEIAPAPPPMEAPADLAEQAPEVHGQPSRQDNLAKEIETERQPQRPSEFAPVTKVPKPEGEYTESAGQPAQDPAAEKPEQRSLPAQDGTAQVAKQDKTPARTSRPADEPALQPTEIAEARPQDGPSHPTGQIHASSVANTHALEAPASDRGVTHGIPAPAVLIPIAGLAIEIAARMQAGRNRFEIRLDPPELGRVDVRLDVDREGNVTSRLVVERTETLDLLRRDASQLERALQQAGLKTGDNSLQFSLRDQSSARHHDDNPNRARVIVPDSDLTAVDTGRIYGRMLGLGGGVDITV